jgi:hypothetical protein
VRGPLSVACMPQGHPVIVQAGASEQGRELGGGQIPDPIDGDTALRPLASYFAPAR